MVLLGVLLVLDLGARGAAGSAPAFTDVPSGAGIPLSQTYALPSGRTLIPTLPKDSLPPGWVSFANGPSFYDGFGAKDPANGCSYTLLMKRTGYRSGDLADTARTARDFWSQYAGRSGFRESAIRTDPDLVVNLGQATQGSDFLEQSNTYTDQGGTGHTIRLLARNFSNIGMADLITYDCPTGAVDEQGFMSLLALSAVTLVNAG